MADRHSTLYSKKGLLTKVQGLEGLAEHLGGNVTVEKLRQTFSSYNEAAKRGLDEFNRTNFPEGHWPIDMTEEFYVGTIVPVIHYTMGGLAIDTDGRVLAADSNEPMEGLYAIGEASGGVHGDNRLAGNSLLECTVFGHHVGRTLAVPSLDKPAVAPAVAAQETVDAPTTAPGTTSNGKRVISAEELAKHNAEADTKWVALYGDVYDLTDYVEEHPGGMEAITDEAGTDGTEKFETVHNKELLESMGFEPVGVLAKTV